MKIPGIATWIPSHPWFLWFLLTNYLRWLYSNTTDSGIPKRVRCFRLAFFNTSIVWIVRINYAVFRLVLNSRIALTHKRNHSAIVNQVLVCLLVLYCKDLKTVCKIALQAEWTWRRQWQTELYTSRILMYVKRQRFRWYEMRIKVTRFVRIGE